MDEAVALQENEDSKRKADFKQGWLMGFRLDDE